MLNQHLGKINTLGSIISMPGFVKQAFLKGDDSVFRISITLHNGSVGSITGRLKQPEKGV